MANKLQLDAFSGKDLQNMQTLLLLAGRAGITKNDMLYEEIEICRQRRRMHDGGATAASEKSMCPSCGRAAMVPPKRKKSDPPLPVLVCPECRYSQYGEVQ